MGEGQDGGKGYPEPQVSEEGVWDSTGKVLIFLRSCSVEDKGKEKRGACLGGEPFSPLCNRYADIRDMSGERVASPTAAAHGGNFDRIRKALGIRRGKTGRELSRDLSRSPHIGEGDKEVGYVKLLLMLTKKCYNSKPTKGR